MYKDKCHYLHFIGEGGLGLIFTQIFKSDPEDLSRISLKHMSCLSPSVSPLAAGTEAIVSLFLRWIPFRIHLALMTGGGDRMSSAGNCCPQTSSSWSPQQPGQFWMERMKDVSGRSGPEDQRTFLACSWLLLEGKLRGFLDKWLVGVELRAALRLMLIRSISTVSDLPYLREEVFRGETWTQVF